MIIMIVVSLWLLNFIADISDDEALNTELAEAYNVTPPFRLHDFNYDSDKLLDVIFGYLERTSFQGFGVSIILKSNSR